MKKLIALSLLIAGLMVPQANAFFFGWWNNCCDTCYDYSYSSCGCC